MDCLGKNKRVVSEWCVEVNQFKLEFKDIKSLVRMKSICLFVIPHIHIVNPCQKLFAQTPSVRDMAGIIQIPHI